MTSELIAKLDAKYPRWNLWRTALKQWCVSFPRPGMEHEARADTVVSDQTIEGVFSKAIAHRHIPSIPRRPSPMNRSDIKPVRDGSKWALMHNGVTFTHNIKTKREAEQYADGFARRAAEAIDAWEREYGTTAAGVEGVDFVYR